MHLFCICFLVPLFRLTVQELDLISSYEDTDALSKNVEISQTENEVLVFDSVSTPLLQEICKNSNVLVYVSDEDITIDCRNFNNEEQPIESGIVKREVEENLDEGSGLGSVPNEVNEVEQNETETIKQEDNSEVPQQSTTPTATTVQSKEDNQVVKETTTSSGKEGEVVELLETEKPQEAAKEETEKPENSEKQNETADVGPENAEKQTETSGFNKTDGEKLGRQLINPKESEEQKANQDVGASSEKPKSAGSKDTTILIVLFVAVVAVGLLAFGYNYVKKRKLRSAEAEDVENAAPVKRSLQNVNGTENEQEKKPLMEKKDVEMVDMKQSATSSDS